MGDDYRFDQAWRYHSHGQDSQAIDILRQLLSEEPNVAIYHGLLSSCLLNKKRLHAAEYEIMVALKLDPALPFLLLVHARVLYFKKDMRQALEVCDQALSINPELETVLILKSQIHDFLDEQDRRLSCLLQAIALTPNDSSSITALGDYYCDRRDYSKAFDMAQNALSVDPQNEDANLLMGRIQLAKGNAEDAQYHAMFAISQNPDSESALRLLCDIKLRKNILIGLWWRFNSSISGMGNLKASFILVIGYMVFSLLSQVLTDFDYSVLANVTSYAWLAIVIYSWLCLPLYYKQLKKELESFQFNPNY